MGTALSRAQSQTDLCVKAASYRMPAVMADGMEVTAVHEATKLAVAHVRAAGAGPYFLELQTYRYRPHSMFDPDLYRQHDEIEAWKKRDPIQHYAARLKKEGKLTGTEYEAIMAKANKRQGEFGQAKASVEFAEAGTPEPVEALLNDVHSLRLNT